MSLDQEKLMQVLFDEGVRQIAEIERLRTALKPFAVIGASDMLKDAKSVTITNPEIFRHAAKVINEQ